jgi:hypothetical protein
LPAGCGLDRTPLAAAAPLQRRRTDQSGGYGRLEFAGNLFVPGFLCIKDIEKNPRDLFSKIPSSQKSSYPIEYIPVLNDLGH